MALLALRILPSEPSRNRAFSVPLTSLAWTRFLEEPSRKMPFQQYLMLLPLILDPVVFLKYTALLLLENERPLMVILRQFMQ